MTNPLFNLACEIHKARSVLEKSIESFFYKKTSYRINYLELLILQSLLHNKALNLYQLSKMLRFEISQISHSIKILKNKHLIKKIRVDSSLIKYSLELESECLKVLLEFREHIIGKLLKSPLFYEQKEEVNLLINEYLSIVNKIEVDPYEHTL